MEQTLSPRFKNLKLWQYQALQMKFENPSIKQTEIAKTFDRADSRVSEFFNSDKYKSALIEYTKETQFELLPKLSKVPEEILAGKNIRAKLELYIKLMEHFGILTQETARTYIDKLYAQVNIIDKGVLEKMGIPELSQKLLEQIKGFKR